MNHATKKTGTSAKAHTSVNKYAAAPTGVVQAIVMHALQLRHTYREVFVLCDIQGRSVRDTAAILGIGPAAVMTRLLRARHQMREMTAHLCEQ